jgi:acetyltransferase-like isoleucine patch superfamily enzyme
MVKRISFFIKYRVLRYFKSRKTILVEQHVKYGTNVSFGKDCIIQDSAFGNHNKVGDDSHIFHTEYGDFSYNSIRATIINCKLGKFCSIAQDVRIGLGKHPVNEFVSTHPAFFSLNKQCGYTFADQPYYKETGSVNIGNDVWIGTNSTILDDVEIGNGAIVAAHSVVNSNVPAYAIVGGSPAKIIKYRFTEKQIDFLQKFKWWDKDMTWLAVNFKDLHDINVLMEKFEDGNR